MMRHFGSYGPLDTEEHFYVPREALIDKAYHQLLGLNQKKSGHYITVWAPRQSGKSWLLREVLYRLKHFQNNAFDVLKLNLEDQKDKTNVPDILQSIAGKIGEDLGKKFTGINDQQKFQDIFKKGALDKPLILILDEFDALEESAINTVVSAFRNIYINRLDQKDKITHEKKYLLHGVALIGVRSVLGIENIKGSPFNVQRSLHVPNLSHDEVTELFRWYEKESGQKVEQEVIDRLYYETMGQPGLTCWFGELLTEGFEGYVPDKTLPVTMKEFEIVYAAAAYVLPNNNILNILSKVSQEKEKEFVLEMFRTDKKIEFRYDDKVINSLYMNGVAGKEVEDRTRYYLRFSCPFVQKRVFSYFSNEIFKRMGTLVEPFTDLDEVIGGDGLSIPHLVQLYRDYLHTNKSWLFKDAPRRSDLKIFEAVFHFNFYSYLNEFLRGKGGRVLPEFPTGNGQIDLIVKYAQKTYGLELKSYSDQSGYRQALGKAAQYGSQLKLREIYLLFFVPFIDAPNRKKYEAGYLDKKTNVKVIPLFIETGS